MEAVAEKKGAVTSIYKDGDLYSLYKVNCTFTGRVYGGIPKNREMLEAWVAAKGEHPREPLEEKLKSIEIYEQMAKEEDHEHDIEEKIEQAYCGFRINEKGIFLREFMIESLIKVCGTTLGLFTKQRGSKGIAQHGLFIDPKEIHFLNKTMPDGYEDFAGTVQTMQGKRSVLKRYDYVENGEIEFIIKLLQKQYQTKLTEKNLHLLLHLGQENGIGSARTLGGGKFFVTQFEKLN